MAHAQVLEEGDVFFFYRPRVEANQVRGREEVQRFYMVLAPERPRKVFRLFVVGRKKLPEVTKGEQAATRQSWALNVRTSSSAEDIRRELLPVEYSTETRGERFTGGVKPVGEGKYQLLRHDGHTEIAYVLELPKELGPAQEEFRIEEQASFIASVKNPDITAPGAPAPRQQPQYPARLREKFGRRRWIDVEDPGLLDYENAQLLLMGAHAGAVEEELGIQIQEEDEWLSSADVCRQLRLSCDRARVKPLLTGEFPTKEEAPPSEPRAREEDRPRAEEVRRPHTE